MNYYPKRKRLRASHCLALLACLFLLRNGHDGDPAPTSCR